MIVTVTTKRQVTFPARVLAALDVQPGDRLVLEERADGYLLRPRRLEPSRLAPLRGRLRRGAGTFDLDTFREQPHDRALRD